MQRVTVSYQPFGEQGPEDPTRLTIIEAHVLPLEDRSRTYAFRGTFRDVPYTLELAGGKLVGLLNLRDPWPFDGILTAGGSTLKAQGHLVDSDIAPYLEFTGSLRSNNLSDLNPLFLSALPDYGPYELHTALSLSDDQLQLNEARLTVGQTDLAGNFAIHFKDDRTQYRAQLTGQTFHTADFKSSKPAPDPQPPSQPSSTASQSFAQQIGLADVDMDLKFAVNNFVADTHNFGRIDLTAQWHDGILRVAPFEAETYGGIFSGELTLDGTLSTPKVSAKVTAQDWNYGQALTDLDLTDHIMGSTNLKASIQGEGTTLQDFINQTTFLLTAGPSSLTVDPPDEEEDPLVVELKHATIQSKKGGRVKAQVKGSFDQHAIELEVETGTLSRLVTSSQSWPISLVGRSGDTSVMIKGGIQQGHPDMKLALGVLLKGKQLNQTVPDLPASRPYGITGWIFTEGGQVRITDLQGRIGRTDIMGTLNGTLNTEPPHLSGTFSSKLVRVADLTTPGDLIFPVDAFHALNLDFNWDIARFDTGIVELGEVSLQGNLTDGRLEVVPVQGKLMEKNVSHATLHGELRFNTHASIPTMRGKISVEDMDLGHIMDQLEFEDPMTGKGTLEATFSSKGKSLFTMLAQPTFQLEATRWQLTSPDQSEELETEVTIEQATLSSLAGGPIELTSKGSYDTIPFTLTASSGDLKDLFTDPLQWPLDLSVKMPKMLVDMSGHLNFPFDGQDFAFHVSFKGDALRQLDLLEKGFASDIVAPLTLDGILTQTQKGYDLTDIKAERGSNNLLGHLSLITTGPRPKVVARLTSDSYEFGFLTRTITEAIDEPEDQPILKGVVSSVKKIGKTAAESVTDLGAQTGKMVTDSLASEKKEDDYEDEEIDEKEPVEKVIPDFDIPVDALRAVDLDIVWDLKEVKSKGTNLGHAVWTIGLENGLLSLDPIDINLWHGKFRGTIELDASLYVPTLSVDLNVNDLDYGFLDKSVGLKDLIRGESESMTVNLKSRGLTFHEILSRANGTATVVDGAITITNSYIDLWAADVFTIALSKAWKKEEATKFNCLVAYMDIVDGKVQSDAVLFDTDRITVGGFGYLDLGTEKLDLILTPQPKNPTLVSLGHPVRVSGSLANPDVTRDKLRIAQGGGWYLLGLINPIGLVVVVPKIAGTTIGTGKKNLCRKAMKDKQLTVKEVEELQEGFFDWSFRKMKEMFESEKDQSDALATDSLPTDSTTTKESEASSSP